MINHLAQCTGMLVIGLAIGFMCFTIMKSLIHMAIDDDYIINAVKRRTKPRSHGSWMLTDDIENIIDDRLEWLQLVKRDREGRVLRKDEL